MDVGSALNSIQYKLSAADAASRQGNGVKAVEELVVAIAGLMDICQKQQDDLDGLRRQIRDERGRA